LSGGGLTREAFGKVLSGGILAADGVAYNIAYNTGP